MHSLKLTDICDYTACRTTVFENYISTENMLPNKGGICAPSNIPNGSAIEYKVGDILISNIRPYFQKIWQAKCDGACSADVLCIRSKSNVDSRYLYYMLSQQAFFDYVMSGAKGCKMPRGDKKQIMQWKISLPSLEEQRKIANFLSSIDEKIELNRRINDNLEQQAQALFKSWFVDFDTIKLGDVVTTTSGGTPSRKYPEYYDGNYGWVKSKELNGSFIIGTEEKITEQAISKSAAKMLPEKSVLIAMYGATVGQYALLSSPMSCNQAVCALLPNENYPYTYLFMFAKNKKEELINKAVGSAQQNISQVLIKDLDISNDILKIKQFHTIVNPFFETIEKNQQEITRLTTLRDTLLPKLMSGDIAIE